MSEEYKYQKEFPDVTLRHLVRHSEGQFVIGVAEDDDLNLDWETTKAYDADHAQRPAEELARHNQLINEAAFVECTPCPHPFSVRLTFKRLVGEGIARTLAHDYDSASQALDHARQYIDARNHEQSRIWYLSASSIAAFVFFCIGTVAWLARSNIINWTGSSMFVLAMASIAGALGAQLSIAMRLGKLDLDCAAGKYLHYVEGISRIVAGMLSGLLAAIAVKLGILVPLVSHADTLPLAIVFAGYVAGAAERWAPSIVAQVSATSATNHTSPSRRPSTPNKPNIERNKS